MLPPQQQLAGPGVNAVERARVERTRAVDTLRQQPVAAPRRTRMSFSSDMILPMTDWFSGAGFIAMAAAWHDPRGAVTQRDGGRRRLRRRPCAAAAAAVAEWPRAIGSGVLQRQHAGPATERSQTEEESCCERSSRRAA